MMLSSWHKKSLFALLAPLVSAAQPAPFDAPQTSQKSFGSIVKSPDVKAQAEIQQQSAKAAVAAAATQPRTSAFITTGEQFQRESERQATSNKQTVEATSAKVVESIKDGLPKFGDLGLHLKLGETITVSPEGKSVIAEIRRLPGLSGPAQQAAIQKLASFASAGIPEALHFMGFLHETGIYNTSKNTSKAFQLYSQAASKQYSPATYNMALMKAYGRGQASDSRQAIHLLVDASSKHRDTSGRVCGMLSFLSYRSGLISESRAAAQGCGSALANLGRATDDKQPLAQRVTWLRDSIATGADDGFAALVKTSRPEAKSDPNATFCKYVLVGKHFHDSNTRNWRGEAIQCLNFIGSEAGGSSGPLSMREQVIQGVSGFVPAEIAELKKLRQANRFRYSWPVPYLPFTQQEVDLFEKAYLAQGFK